MTGGSGPIHEDCQGNLWFARGWSVSLYDGKTFTTFTVKEGLLGGKINSILEDGNGNLWFGNNRSGVSMFNGETFTHFTENQGLSDNFVSSILEDSNNNIWVGTSKGLNCLVIGKGVDIETEGSISEHDPVIHTFGWLDGLKGSEFTRAALVDNKNRLWWGHKKGLTMLDMSNLKISEPPDLQLYQIDINGLFIDYRHLASKDKKNIEFNEVPRFCNYPLNLELPYKRNHLTFHFSALEWSARQKIKYSYTMEGLDDRWSSPTTEASADYRNLPHGSYTFKVCAIGAAHKWSEPFEYSFRILSPFWFSWWAYLIYGFILVILIRWYRRLLIRREKIKADLKIKEMEVNKMQELDHMKSRFFANISHEFRTPLTLIQGPIEEMQRDLPNLPVEKTRELLLFMNRNTKRLQQLIGQILDVSKLETGKVKLLVSEGKLEQFVKTIILSFLSLAETKKIKYIYDLHETSHLAFFDRDKLEKILTNLISNAFKFTAEGDKILVSLTFLSASEDKTPEHVSIEITDTGKGIPRNNLDRVFDRFYQVSDTDERDAEGTGLGLALTKELVDLYRGEISVDSQEGFGSTFTVKLPVSKALFTEAEMAPRQGSGDKKSEPIELVNDLQAHKGIDAEEDLVQTTKADKPEILIVEDNEDLRNYLSRNLENDYRIIKATNGMIGLDVAFQCIPDLIISDLMMPKMDGMKMVQHLKSSELTDHIPVIILTAKADRDSKLAGLEKGVDDYIIKPFDAEELRVRVKNLIQQRQKLRDRYRREFLSDLKGPDIPAPEDKFLVRAVNCINKHMTESEFNVTQLGKELGLSRTQLYRKILALTDHTPNEFIRNYRLKMAARMFHEGHKNITRVVYSAGFNTPAYFTQCFREVYGVNPSEYIKNKELT